MVCIKVRALLSPKKPLPFTGVQHMQHFLKSLLNQLLIKKRVGFKRSVFWLKWLVFWLKWSVKFD